MAVYLVGVAKSWMYWPFLAGVVFLWKYKKAKRRFEEKHPGQLALAWPIDGQVQCTTRWAPPEPDIKSASHVIVTRNCFCAI